MPYTESVRESARASAPPSSRRHFRKSGSVLIAVLGFLFIGSILVTIIIERAVRDITYRGVQDYRPDFRREAFSALQACIAVLAEYKEIDGQLSGAGQGWDDLLSHADYTPQAGFRVSARIRDESGRIPLNSENPELIIALFDKLEINLTEAERLADALVDWIDADDLVRNFGAENETYEAKNPPYRPANRPIRSFQELRLIEGFDRTFWDETGQPNALFASLREHVSLYHQGRIHVHGAPTLILETLATLTQADTFLLTQHLAGPDGILGTADDRSLRDAITSPMPDNAAFQQRVTDTATIITLEITVQRGDLASSLSALIDLTTADQISVPNGEPLTLPFKILALAENQSL